MKRRLYRGKIRCVTAGWPLVFHELLVRMGGIYRARFGANITIQEGAMIAVLFEAQRCGLSVPEECFEVLNKVHPDDLHLETTQEFRIVGDLGLVRNVAEGVPDGYVESVKNDAEGGKQ